MAKVITVGRYPELAFGTFGWVTISGTDFGCYSLELPWKDNAEDISCIPTGVYAARFEFSPAFNQNLWELKGVPGRKETKFHPANVAKQLKGCIALGDALGCVDNQWAVLHSVATINRFHEVLKSEEGKDLEVYVVNLFQRSYGTKTVAPSWRFGPQ